MPRERVDRRDQILQTLARLLQDAPHEKLTTAALARAEGVSEAALYRHFPSKARMYEALIEFAEDAVFSRINQMMEHESSAPRRCELLMTIALGFSEHNPGINRVLMGDALAGENERVRRRAAGFAERLETQLRQILREANLDPQLRLRLDPVAASQMMANYLMGALTAFARTPDRAPGAKWDVIWPTLREAVFASGN